MGVLRRFLSVSVGVAAGAFAYKLLKDYNDKNLVNQEYVEVPTDGQEPAEKAKASEDVVPQKAVQQPDNGPNVNPVSLGAAEKPLTENGKLDPTRIASPEDFASWDDLGCQG